jgi:hypothetical protein
MFFQMERLSFRPQKNHEAGETPALQCPSRQSALENEGA